MRFERTNKRAILPLRAEVRVDLPEGWLGRQLLDTARGLHRQSGADLNRPVGPEVPGRFDNEDHIDVADVVELPRPGLTHPDDGQSRVGDFRVGVAGAAAGHLQRRIQRCTSQVGEHPRNL